MLVNFLAVRRFEIKMRRKPFDSRTMERVSPLNGLNVLNDLNVWNALNELI